MKTPAFWNEHNTLSNLLVPLSYLYQWIGKIRYIYIKPARFPIPVVCIGNVTAGGSGKTPVALHVGTLLKKRGYNAYYLSRGYGGILDGPVVVDPKKHSAKDVGDEPLLLAQTLPTIVSKDRVAGARLALQKGAALIIMDDGFQNPSIAKSLSLVIIDGKIGFGNGRLIPAGPLREPPQESFKRAHAAIILNRSTAVPALPKGMMALYGKTQLKDADFLQGKKIFAFCGLAYPNKFFDMLRSSGAKVVGTESFADHHYFSQKDMNKLLAQSLSGDAALVTTAKDAVRIPPEFRECVAVIDMEIVFDDQVMLDGIISYMINPTT